MVELWTKLIEENRKTLDDVPDRYREAVESCFKKESDYPINSA